MSHDIRRKNIPPEFIKFIYMETNNRHIWEGWTVQDFIDEVQVFFNYWPYIDDPKKLRDEVKGAQPYYKKHIPEVYKHFKLLNDKKSWR